MISDQEIREKLRFWREVWRSDPKQRRWAAIQLDRWLDELAPRL